jgi:hypothetical protein
MQGHPPVSGPSAFCATDNPHPAQSEGASPVELGQVEDFVTLRNCAVRLLGEEYAQAGITELDAALHERMAELREQAQQAPEFDFVALEAEAVRQLSFALTHSHERIVLH